MKVFISWSGEPSKAIALALRDWLPLVLQQVEPFMSKRDIPSGSRWSTEIGTHLSESGFGILCVTPDNPKAEWLLFEAGALAKKLDDRVCPYVVGMEPTDLPIFGPLNQFQAKRATRDETFDLVADINSLLGDATLDQKRLEATFEAFWPKLMPKLTLPAPPEQERKPDSGPSTDDMVREILETVRAIARTPQTPILYPNIVEAVEEWARNRTPIPSVGVWSNALKRVLTAFATNGPLQHLLATTGAEISSVRIAPEGAFLASVKMPDGRLEEVEYTPTTYDASRFDNAALGLASLVMAKVQADRGAKGS